jgi:hypothetical protein
MRNVFRYSVTMLIMGTLSFMGCSDGGTTNTDTSTSVDAGDTIGEQDTSGQADSTAADTASVDTNVEPLNPCEPNPCAPKAASCEGDVLTSFAAGTCTDDNGAAKCDYAETTKDCTDDGSTCINGQCLVAGNPVDFVFTETSSVLTSLEIGGVSDKDDCCFDFTGDGEMDNALGKLIKGLGGVLGDTDVNAEITENIQSGGLVILFDYAGLDDMTADESLTINGFYGVDTDDDYTDNIAGTGSFLVEETSFIEGTATPVAQFVGGQIAGGKMTGGPAKFVLAFPIGNIKLKATVSGTLVEANVAAGPNGKGIEFTDAKLGGYIKMDDLYNALNTYVSSSCECLGLGESPLIGFNADKGKMECTKIENSSCDAEDEDQSTCAQLGSFCGAALLFLKPDVDSDNDDEKDAMSVGAWISATSATITGLQPTP